MAVKIGKLSENAMKRSVFKQFKVRRPETILGPGVGEDCAAVKLAEGEVTVLTTDPVMGTMDDLGKMGVLSVINDLASSGAEPVGLLITAIFPEGTEEADIRKVAMEVGEICQIWNLEMLGGHTALSAVVNQPLLSVMGLGKCQEGDLVTTSGAMPGDDIVITKWIGLEGTCLLAKSHQEKLLTRYPFRYIQGAQEFDKYLCLLPDARAAKACKEAGVHAMHDVTEGGIFGALWELGSASKVGLTIDVKKIPIRQETVEICEFFNLNPYELIGGGSLLIAARDGESLVRALADAGIPASLVGKATDSNDRILQNDDEIRYLEPAKPDELYRLK